MTIAIWNEMAVLSIDCPHCFTGNMAFVSVGPAVINHVSKNYISLFQCQKCYCGIVVELQGSPTPHWLGGQMPFFGIQVVECWPKSILIEAPTHTPENIQRFYVQGLKALSREDFDAAGIMFRKSLDISVKHLHPGGKGNLKQRIDSIPSEAGITQAMKDWAHIIRDDGNDAAHEAEPFTERQAEAMKAFTETFLTYAFSLPTMVKERRSETESD